MIRDESGGSLIDFAITTPLLFIIAFGIMEFGILLYDKAVITNASREAARAGIVFDTARIINPDRKQVNRPDQEYGFKCRVTRVLPLESRRHLVGT